MKKTEARSVMTKAIKYDVARVGVTQTSLICDPCNSFWKFTRSGIRTLDFAIGIAIEVFAKSSFISA